MAQELNEQLDRFNNGIARIENVCGYTFKNKNLLLQAFTTKSFSEDYKNEFGIDFESNEVLSYIGQKYYDLAITKTELDMHGKVNENGKYISSYTIKTLAERNQKINNECKNSDAIAITFLFTSLLIGKNESNEVRVVPKVMAELYMAIIGAIAVDSDFDFKAIFDVSEKMSKIKSKLTMLDTIYKNLGDKEITLL